MTADQLITDVLYHVDDKALDSATLHNLGYLPTTNTISIKASMKDKELNITVFEVVDERDRPRDFCFAYNNISKTGFILPYAFTRYEKLRSMILNN